MAICHVDSIYFPSTRGAGLNAQHSIATIIINRIIDLLTRRRGVSSLPVSGG